MKKVTIDFYEDIEQPFVTLDIIYNSYEELEAQLDRVKEPIIVEVSGQPNRKQMRLLQFLEEYQIRSQTFYLIRM